LGWKPFCSTTSRHKLSEQTNERACGRDWPGSRVHAVRAGQHRHTHLNCCCHQVAETASVQASSWQLHRRQGARLCVRHYHSRVSENQAHQCLGSVRNRRGSRCLYMQRQGARTVTGCTGAAGRRSKRRGWGAGQQRLRPRKCGLPASVTAGLLTCWRMLLLCGCWAIMQKQTMCTSYSTSHKVYHPSSIGHIISCCCW
jgi:hypothetical protein